MRPHGLLSSSSFIFRVPKERVADRSRERPAQEAFHEHSASVSPLTVNPTTRKASRSSPRVALQKSAAQRSGPLLFQGAETSASWGPTGLFWGSFWDLPGVFLRPVWAVLRLFLDLSGGFLGWDLPGVSLWPVWALLGPFLGLLESFLTLSREGQPKSAEKLHQWGGEPIHQSGEAPRLGLFGPQPRRKGL